MDTHTTAPAAEGGPSESLFIERTGKRQYVARNHRDAAVNIGDGPGEFTPLEDRRGSMQCDVVRFASELRAW